MKAVVLTLLLFFALSVNADNALHTLTLKHRLANDIVNQIEPFLPSTATIKAHDNLLFLKSDRATLANVEELVKQLDKPLKSVIVSIRRTNEALDSAQFKQDALAVELGDENKARASIKRWSTNSNQDKNDIYRATGISGHSIAINLGTLTPDNQQTIYLTPNGGVALASNTEYVSVSSGFNAKPFLLPDEHVKIEISPFFAERSSVTGEISSSNILSTINGPLGQWIPIGYIGEQKQSSSSGGKRYSTQQNFQQLIYIKVDIENN